MELHERLATSRTAPPPRGQDPFSEVKNRIHMAAIAELGPQLFNVAMDPIALRDRVTNDLRNRLSLEAAIPRLSLSGPLVTIRKFSKKRLDLTDLIKLGTLSMETVEFLQRCILAELNILISGGTGTGKTTLLNALSTAIPDSDRIVTIEDAAELRLNQRHVLRLEGRPKNIEGEGEITIRDLVRNSLRMRPDRIIVGEVRGAEALDMLQAMNTGH